MTVQILRVCFNVHEPPCSDRPKVSEVSILAVESLLRRRISQRGVCSQITEVDSRQHQLSPEKLGYTNRRASSALSQQSSFLDAHLLIVVGCWEKQNPALWLYHGSTV